MKQLEIKAKYDVEDKVWFIVESDIPGLHVEAETFEQLLEVIYDVAGELIEANLPDYVLSAPDVPLYVMAQSLVHARVGHC